MKESKSRLGAIIVGLIVILVGVGIVAKNMGYELHLSSLLFDGWWTVFIIVPGVIGLFRKDSNKVFSAVLIAVGVALLAGQYIQLNIWHWVAPVAVIAVGVSIAAGAFRKNDDGNTGSDDSKDAE